MYSCYINQAINPRDQMRGYINKEVILELYSRMSYFEKFESVAAVINATLPIDEKLSEADYYFTIYSIWKIIEDNT